jgi:hypothetical protein
LEVGDGTRVSLVANCEIGGPMRLAGPLLRWGVARADDGQIEALKHFIETS